MDWIAMFVLAAHPLVRVAGVGLYAAATAGCVAAARRGRRAYWAGTGVLQALMGLDAAVGLRHALAEAGRAISRAEGWYESRRAMQLAVSLVGVVVVLAVAGGLVWRLRRDGGVAGRDGRACEVAAIGTGLSLVLVVLTAVSLHAVEAALAWPASWFNGGLILRGMGAVLVFVGAWWFLGGGSAGAKMNEAPGDAGASR